MHVTALQLCSVANAPDPLLVVGAHTKLTAPVEPTAHSEAKVAFSDRVNAPLKPGRQGNTSTEPNDWLASRTAVLSTAEKSALSGLGTDASVPLHVAPAQPVSVSSAVTKRQGRAFGNYLRSWFARRDSETGPRCTRCNLSGRYRLDTYPLRSLCTPSSAEG